MWNTEIEIEFQSKGDVLRSILFKLTSKLKTE